MLEAKGLSLWHTPPARYNVARARRGDFAALTAITKLISLFGQRCTS